MHQQPMLPAVTRNQRKLPVLFHALAEMICSRIRENSDVGSLSNSEGPHFLLQTLAVNSESASCSADIAVVQF